MKIALYAFVGMAIVASQAQANLTERLTSSQSEISATRQAVEQNDFIAQSKCGKIGSCGQACGNKN